MPNFAGCGEPAQNAVNIPDAVPFPGKPRMKVQSEIGRERTALFVKTLESAAGTIDENRKGAASGAT